MKKEQIKKEQERINKEFNEITRQMQMHQQEFQSLNEKRMKLKGQYEYLENKLENNGD